MVDFFKFKESLEEAKVKQSKKPSEVYEDELEKDSDDPCWDGYVQLGTKMKNGKEVPNCVPMKEARKQMKNEATSYEDDIDPNKKIVVKGTKGMNSKKFTKTFRNMKAADKWMDDNEDDIEIKQVMNESTLVEGYYDAPDYGPIGASEMAQTQLHFIKYAADDVTRCLKSGCPMPEWYQNKLAKIEGDMEGLYSYMKGKTRKMKAHQDDRYSMGMSMYGEETLTEGVKVKHDRYKRTHGKNASGKGTWAFTTKSSGDPSNDEIYMGKSGQSVKDAAKDAAEALGSNEVYVMESAADWLDKFHFIAKRHGGKVQKGINEQAKSGDDDAYDKFFRAALRKYGVEDPGDLSKEKKKEFFNYVDRNWKADDEKTVNEEAKSGDKEAYTKFFNKALKRFGVDSPAELKGEKEKEFYDYVDKNWKSDKELKNEFTEYVTEKLKPSDDVSKWIEDFYASDAPQFKGKDKEARREMAVAAWLEARREAGYDVDKNPNKD